MKKLSVLTVMAAFLVLCATPAAGQSQREFNVLGGLGFATSDFKGLVFDIGAELQLSQNLYVQALFDMYPEPFDEDELGVSDVDYSAYGLTLYGVFKVTASDKLKFYVKGGLNFTSVKVSGQVMGIGASSSDTDLGLGGGIGAEYSINDRFSVLLGGTTKYIFDEYENGHWFKVYAGILYKVR